MSQSIPASYPFSPFAAQRRQADAGGVEAAIDRQDLSGDVAGAIAAQEEPRPRVPLEAVAVERNSVVIVGADFRGVHRLGHRGLDRSRRDGIDANAERGQFDGELLGEVREPGLAGAVGGAQREARTAEIEVMLTTAPPPCSRIRGAAALVHRNGPVRLTASTRLQSSSVVSSNGVNTAIPALLTNASSRPKRLLDLRDRAPATAAGVGDVAMQRQRASGRASAATAPRSVRARCRAAPRASPRRGTASPPQGRGRAQRR